MSDTAQNKNGVGAIIVNYRIMCDVALSERDDGFYSQEEYETAITKQLEAATQALDDFYRNKILEADIKARIDEWENIDGDDTHYWDYREVGNTTEKVYLTPVERNDELEAQLTAQFNSKDVCGICGDGGHSAFACTNQSQSTKQESR